jgi:hypothetical protein
MISHDECSLYFSEKRFDEPLLKELEVKKEETFQTSVIQYISQDWTLKEQQSSISLKKVNSNQIHWEQIEFLIFTVLDI